ncbi:hypothetical protein M9H77_14156 [Catharanthus roseus]|uniref:Uncharacterized protein n=1 Tax=Catharanthus roseus TaxID=4058 RepID=A0ACC0BM81_CATRO|nr:hypothetical protein M9H77_14156 [Catharanthus roseus]
MVAELWGLRDGLHQAISLCIDMLEVEVDSKAIVELINNSAPNDFIFSSLIYDCRLLLGSFRASRLYHVYQEANKLADCLARTGANNVSLFNLGLLPQSSNNSRLQPTAADDPHLTPLSPPIGHSLQTTPRRIDTSAAPLCTTDSLRGSAAAHATRNDDKETMELKLKETLSSKADSNFLNVSEDEDDEDGVEK